MIRLIIKYKFLFKLQMLFAICLICAAQKTIAQDILFSQFHNAPLMRNPAFGGILKKDIRVIANHRSQWEGFGAIPFSTQAASVELRLNKPRSIAVGAQFITDRAGDAGFRRTQILPFISNYVTINENTFLNVAFLAGPVSTGFDITKLYFDDQYVPGSPGPAQPTNTTFSTTNKNYFDISTGVAINQNFDGGLSWYAGLAAYHVSKPNVGFDVAKVTIPIRWCANAGVNLPLSTNNKLMLQGDYFYQNKKAYLQAGILFQQSLINSVDDEDPRLLSAGAFVRWNDVVIPTVQLDITRNFTLGISYDITISSQPRVYSAKNGLELSITYNGGIKERAYLPCPRF
jgi:type IX secretion system PorP/SprF family membrane protein